MKKITIAIDSFKGSLSSGEVAEAVAQGIHAILPHCEVSKVNIADGGEGTAEALVESLGGEWVEMEASDPLGRPVGVRYGVIDGGECAVVEMATASGLPLLRPEERNPLLTSTLGTGEMIADAIRRGCRRFLVAIGGSATNDCGIGMLHALGYRFVDAEGQEIVPCGEALARIARIDDRGVVPELKECGFVVACDVTNPLYGPNGAAHVFAPQKGATPQMVEQLDGGLRNFARVVREYNGFCVDFVEGAGAAGGLGAGFVGVLGAKLQRGIDMVMEALRFEDVLRGSDLAITGEGCIDFQTVMGKAPSGVLHTATRLGIPVVAIGGGVRWCKELEESNFVAIIAATPDGMELQEAMRPEVAKENVRRASEQIIRGLVESK
ncbi:MAG: glycerate kinase [Tidjanibacter sp.]|nr:glycerate kinase [Tidjanibacter sp.]